MEQIDIEHFCGDVDLSRDGLDGHAASSDKLRFDRSGLYRAVYTNGAVIVVNDLHLYLPLILKNH